MSASLCRWPWAPRPDQDHHMVVVLAIKKDGLVLPDSRQEGRPVHAPVERSRRDGRVLCRYGVHASASGRTRMPVSVDGTAHC